MGTALKAVAQIVNCLYDSVDMRDFMMRGATAMREFCRRRAAGEACLGPFNVLDDPTNKTFFVYGPLLFTSWDRLMGGDYGITPAFFWQSPEQKGEGIGQNKYSYSVYLSMPVTSGCSAGNTTTQALKYPGTVESARM